MAGIEDIIEIYRGENLIDKFKMLREIKKDKWVPGINKIGKFATDKLAHAQDYAGKFPNIIKSAKLPKETVEFGKKLFDKAHFKQMADHTGHRSRLLMPKKAQEKLKIDILKTIASNAKALTPLALKGLSVVASLPAQVVVMTLAPTEANADEVNMTLEDFAKLAEENQPKEKMATGGKAYSTDIKDYYRRAWGLEDRPGFKYGGSWADWKVNYEDQMTFEEYLQDDNIVKKPHILDRKAKGGRVKPQRRLKAALPLLAPALLPYAAAFIGTTATGLMAQQKIQNYFENNPDALDKFKEYVSRYIPAIHGGEGPMDPPETESFPDQSEEWAKSFGDNEGTKIPEPEKQKPPVSGDIVLPPQLGGSEIPETKKEDIIFTSKSAEKAPGEAKKEYGKKALEDLNPETLTDIDTIIKDYRDLKTRPAGIYDGRFRKASTQPKMNEADKVELIELVIEKYKEKENKLPSVTELQAFLPSLNVGSLAKKNNIDLGKRKADFDRSDPEYIENVRKNKKLKANENSTITNFAGENFFPDTIKLKDGSVVDAEKFFIDNLVKRTESGPGRKETVEITLKNKELAKLFNTNVRKIEEVIKNIRNNPDFTADFPPNRDVEFYRLQNAERIKKAREYLTKQELKNVIIQENQLWELNKMFKDGTLVVTDFPNLVERINTTVDKKTGKIDRTIKKTKKEMIERSKDNAGLFNISHTIPKTSEQQNIEFIRNRNLADYKTNQGLFKSFEAYVRNQTDDPEYDLRLQEFDTYMKEMGQRVKIGNRFFGLDEAMIDSNTGEFLGINRQLEYYGLPKFENGVPLKKVKTVKKADGGLSGVDYYIMNRYR